LVSKITLLLDVPNKLFDNFEDLKSSLLKQKEQESIKQETEPISESEREPESEHKR